MGSSRQEGVVWLLTASAEPPGRDGAVWSPPWAISAWDERGEKTFMEPASDCSFQGFVLDQLRVSVDGLPWPVSL